MVERREGEQASDFLTRLDDDCCPSFSRSPSVPISNVDLITYNMSAVLTWTLLSDIIAIMRIKYGGLK